MLNLSLTEIIICLIPYPLHSENRSLFYLLSNNHVNDMIMFDFRLEDEEVLSHFASFLKTLSLRLNENTVQVT